jgi:hypothetical protein
MMLEEDCLRNTHGCFLPGPDKGRHAFTRLENIRRQIIRLTRQLDKLQP